MKHAGEKMKVKDEELHRKRQVMKEYQRLEGLSVCYTCRVASEQTFPFVRG